MKDFEIKLHKVIIILNQIGRLILILSLLQILKLHSKLIGKNSRKILERSPILKDLSI